MHDDKLICGKSFTQRNFTQRSLCTEQLSHRTCTNRNLYTHTHRSFYTEKLLHSKAFSTQTHLHTEAFTQGASTHSQKLIHREEFTRRSPVAKLQLYLRFDFDHHFIRRGCVLSCKITILHQFLSFDLQFVRRGCVVIVSTLQF